MFSADNICQVDAESPYILEKKQRENLDGCSDDVFSSDAVGNGGHCLSVSLPSLSCTLDVLLPFSVLFPVYGFYGSPKIPEHQQTRNTNP